MYVDITCGSVVRGHPELGDDARRRCAAQGGDDTIRLKLILYYDEVEICNPLGYAAGKHKLGLFYFALVDLPPNLRMALHNIQLATVCLDKDFSYYGATQIICGPPGEPSHKGTSIGAALERLNAGREMFMPDGGMSMEPRTFKAWAICLAADYPAAGGCHLAATVHSLHLTPPTPHPFVSREVPWLLRERLGPLLLPWVPHQQEGRQRVADALLLRAASCKCRNLRSLRTAQRHFARRG